MSSCILADWQDEADYPPAGDLTMPARWHWEFLRRSPVYQEDLERYGFLCHNNDRSAALLIARKYGLGAGMLDYRDPHLNLFSSKRSGDPVRLVYWQSQWQEDEYGAEYEAPLDDLSHLDPELKQHECCVVFNLREPVAQQIAKAHDQLLKVQAQFHTRRGNSSHYQRYLRLLDAVDTGAGILEIGMALFADLDLAQRRERITLELQESRRLRDVGYQFM